MSYSLETLNSSARKSARSIFPLVVFGRNRTHKLYPSRILVRRSLFPAESLQICNMCRFIHIQKIITKDDNGFYNLDTLTIGATTADSTTDGCFLSVASTSIACEIPFFGPPISGFPRHSSAGIKITLEDIHCRRTLTCRSRNGHITLHMRAYLKT
jgi:hypothetical protein